MSLWSRYQEEEYVAVTTEGGVAVGSMLIYACASVAGGTTRCHGLAARNINKGKKSEYK